MGHPDDRRTPFHLPIHYSLNRVDGAGVDESTPNQLLDCHTLCDRHSGMLCPVVDLWHGRTQFSQ